MKVSIIIPVYNVEKYISECLKSVINQTYKNIEIIVVIDGSKDNSSKIVYEFAKNDSRIKIIDRENKGVLYSRIEGLKHSRCKYVMFVDGDDMLKLDAVQIMIKTIMKEKSDIVKANYIKQKQNIIIKNKSYVNKKITFSKDEFEPIIYDLLYEDIYFNSMCYCLFKKELFKNLSFQYDLKYGEDLTTMLDIIYNCNTITIIPNYVYIYNINPNGITLVKNSEKLKKKIEDTKKIYKNLYNYVDIYPIKSKDYYHKLSNTKLVLYLIIHFLNLSCISKKFKSNFIELQNSLKNVNMKKIDKKFLKKYNVIYRISIRHSKNYILLYLISNLYKIFK